MFAFALKMLWEAWRMGEGELEETQKEVEQELAELDDGQPQVHNVSMHCMVHTLLVYITLLLCTCHHGDCCSSKQTVREGMLMGRVKFQLEQTMLASRDLLLQNGYAH